MAAHLFWRVLFAWRDGNRMVQVAEMQMRASVGGANQCSGGVASASAGSVNAPANAFDASTATYWQSDQGASGTRWLQYAFATAVSVEEIAVTWGPSSSGVAASAWLQWSDDGLAWTLLSPFIGCFDDAPGSTRVVNGFAPPSNPHLTGSFSRLPTAWPTGPVGARIRGSALRHDSVDGGAYGITSTVTIAGTPDAPVARPVYLFTGDSLRLIRSIWSDPVTGAYTFEKLRLQPYVVMARDYTAYYNAVVADRITPVL